MAAKRKKKHAAPSTVPVGDLAKRGDKASVHRDSIVKRTADEMLPVKVGHEKVEVAAKLMAKLHHEREAIKSEKRDVLAKFRDKLNSIDEQTSQCADTVDQSTELRKVEVVDRLLPTGVIERVRTDNGTLIEDARAATAEELQDTVPGVDDKPVKGPTPFGAEAGDEELPGPKSKAKKK